jgi:hypothetical protein
LPERPSSACSSSTLGRSTDLRTRGLSPGRVRIENLCLSTSRSRCSPTLPDGQAIATDIGSDKPVPADLQSARDGYSHCSSFPQGTATSRREAAMAADDGLVRGFPPPAPRERRYRRLARVGGVEADKLSENFRLIIPSADKELFLQDRCRRSTGNGYRCRPDGPWRGERIPGQRQTPRLLPPMETAQVQ